MANTTNFGWETPDDTDLVKDGAAAMRTLGNSIDASFVDLKGGTTGQILSKNSNTDLDYIWINNDQGDITAVTAGTGISGGGTTGAVTITNSMATEITASGDIIVGTGSGTFDNLPIGTTGQVLTADTTVSPYKVKWATATSGANWSLVNAGGTALTGASTITISGISNADKIMMLVVDGSSASASSTFHCRLNADTGANYNFVGHYHPISSTYDGADISGIGLLGEIWIRLAKMSTSASSVINAAITFTGCNASGVKAYAATAGNSGGASGATYITQGFWSGSATVTSISIISSTGNFDAGTVYVYTSA